MTRLIFNNYYKAGCANPFQGHKRLWPSTTHTLVWHCTWSTPKPQPSLSQTGEGSPLDDPERDLRCPPVY